jgi:ABC-type Mn2+/Zn2+ transport system ATPase subunit
VSARNETLAPTVLVELLDAGIAGESGRVLEGVNLQARSGEILGIVGPSGAGKTTLLRLMGGTVEPTSGSVARKPGLRLGYVPQLETVDWKFPITVGECVLMGRPGRRWGWRDRGARAALSEVLARLALDGLADRHIGSLSGGQRQRVFIARALLCEPELLLLDEPTSGVDVALRHELLHLLAELCGQEMAVVLTTHDLNGVAGHLPRLGLLNRRLVACGPPSEVLSPANLEETYGASMDVLEHGGMRLVVDTASHRHGYEFPVASQPAEARAVDR